MHRSAIEVIVRSCPFALAALQWACGPAPRAGQDTSDLIQHSDRGVQYLAVRYTQRLAESGGHCTPPP